MAWDIHSVCGGDPEHAKELEEEYFPVLAIKYGILKERIRNLEGKNYASVVPSNFFTGPGLARTAGLALIGGAIIYAFVKLKGGQQQ